MTKKLPNNLHGGAFYEIAKFVLTNKLPQFPSQKSSQA